MEGLYYWLLVIWGQFEFCLYLVKPGGSCTLLVSFSLVLSVSFQALVPAVVWWWSFLVLLLQQRGCWFRKAHSGSAQAVGVCQCNVRWSHLCAWQEKRGCAGSVWKSGHCALRYLQCILSHWLLSVAYLPASTDLCEKGLKMQIISDRSS